MRRLLRSTPVMMMMMMTGITITIRSRTRTRTRTRTTPTPTTHTHPDNHTHTHNHNHTDNHTHYHHGGSNGISPYEVPEDAGKYSFHKRIVVSWRLRFAMCVISVDQRL